MNPYSSLALDGFYCFCLGLDLLSTTTLHTAIRTFIRSKPEGNKTVIANINISCSYVWQTIPTLICPVFLYRITFGTISTNFLVIHKVLGSCCINSAIFLHAFANVIKIFFLVDFDRMSSFDEGVIMKLGYIFTSGIVGGGIIFEYFIGQRYIDGPAFVYLGDENSRGKIPDFLYVTLFNFLTLVVSLLLMLVCQLTR